MNRMKGNEIDVNDWKSKPLEIPPSPYNLTQIKEIVRIARFRLAALDVLNATRNNEKELEEDGERDEEEEKGIGEGKRGKQRSNTIKPL